MVGVCLEHVGALGWPMWWKQGERGGKEKYGQRGNRNWKVFGVCFEFDVKLESFEKKNLMVSKNVLAVVLRIQSLGGQGWQHRPVRRLLQ